MVKGYDASSITVLDEVEGIRANPGVYLGDRGTLQCFKEVLQNATDETTECGGGRVRVVLDGGRVLISDEGRGIPVEPHPKTGVSTLITVMTRLHAGGKSKNKVAYGGKTIGAHGMGASIVCALSDKMSVRTMRSGGWHRVDFVRGKPQGGVTRCLPPEVRWARGTIVEYVIDASILPEPLDKKAVKNLCDLARHFSPVDVALTIDGETWNLGRKDPKALLSRVVARTGASTVLGPLSISSGGIRLVLAWVESPDRFVDAYVSGAPVPSGSHVAGLDDAIRSAFKAALPRGVRTPDDPTTGMVAVLDASVDQPTFSGQAKTALTKKQTRRDVFNAVVGPLTKFLRSNRKSLVEVAERAARIGDLDREHKERRRLAKDAGVATRGRLSLPKGFLAALSTPPQKRETYVMEGPSALGTGKNAKMPWQEILPIRGKLPNVFRKKNALKNDIVASCVQAVGYDPRNSVRPLRTGKLILLADADDDGDHITCLLVGMIQRVMPELLATGKVYVVEAPLYVAMTSDGTMVSGNSLGEIEKNYGKVTGVNRMKGWGSCDAHLLRKLAFDPATRKICRVANPTAKESRAFALLMGKDSSTRRELLGNISEINHDWKARHVKEAQERRIRRKRHQAAAEPAASSNGRAGSEPRRGSRFSRGRNAGRSGRAAPGGSK